MIFPLPHEDHGATTTEPPAPAISIGHLRARLAPRDPLVEMLVVDLGDDVDLSEVRAWCLGLVRARNRWDIARRTHGLFGSRLTKADAHAALGRALVALANGGEL